MPTPEIIPIVLNLVRIHNSSLRRVCSWSKREKGWVTKHDSSNSIIDSALVGNRVADGISAKFHIYAAIGCSKFVGHPTRECSSPAERIVLCESRDVIRI